MMCAMTSSSLASPILTGLFAFAGIVLAQIVVVWSQ
jgi:hypothetical protein